jgi:hypothetical protein
MQNDHDVNAPTGVAGRLRVWIRRSGARWAKLSGTHAWWRRPQSRWVAAAALGLIVLAPIADTVTGEGTPPAATTTANADDGGRAAGDTASRGQAHTGTKAKPQPKSTAKGEKPATVKPVAGLSQAQMDNAAIIVQTGKDLGLPKRAHVIAVATAMQESRLLNLANPTVPHSLALKSQGYGYDHDSIGLFQQRPSSGWGSPAQLLDQRYAATQFYNVLRTVPGWDRMALTWAAQSVQVSAFPYAYAQHEWAATQVVNALDR